MPLGTSATSLRRSHAHCFLPLCKHCQCRCRNATVPATTLGSEGWRKAETKCCCGLPARVWHLSKASRFCLTLSSSAMTKTLSKKASTGPTSCSAANRSSGTVVDDDTCRQTGHLIHSMQISLAYRPVCAHCLCCRRLITPSSLRAVHSPAS